MRLETVEQTRLVGPNADPDAVRLDAGPGGPRETVDPNGPRGVPFQSRHHAGKTRHLAFSLLADCSVAEGAFEKINPQTVPAVEEAFGDQPELFRTQFLLDA
jgi:hypothetical protein